jgi:hypothetical protein
MVLISFLKRLGQGTVGKALKVSVGMQSTADAGGLANKDKERTPAE